jgi:hypothetical protein
MAKPDVVIEASTLLGDVRDALLDRLRAMAKPWPQMTDAEQHDAIEGATTVAKHLVEQAVRLVAAQGFPTIGGKLVKCQIKDGMQLQVDVSRHDPQRLTVIDNVGRPVVLVVTAPELFAGEKRRPRTTLEDRVGLK